MQLNEKLIVMSYREMKKGKLLRNTLIKYNQPKFRNKKIEEDADAWGIFVRNTTAFAASDGVDLIFINIHIFLYSQTQVKNIINLTKFFWLIFDIQKNTLKDTIVNNGIYYGMNNIT